LVPIAGQDGGQKVMWWKTEPTEVAEINKKLKLVTQSTE